MFRGRADHGGWPNSLIEGHQAAVISDRQRQEISIRDLLRPEQLAVGEHLDIGKADIVGPEAMVLSRLRHAKALQDCGEPRRGSLVADVVGVKQRDKNVTSSSARTQ